MEVTPLLKPKRKPKSSRQPNPQKQQRIIDPQAMKDTEKPYCQNCGLSTSNVKYNPPHHIVKRSQGGSDIPENLISLCYGPGSNDCHDKADKGILTKEHLREMKRLDVWKWEGGE